MAKSRRPLSVSVVALAAVVLVAVGVIAGAVLLPQPPPASVVTSAQDGMVDVSGQMYDGSHSVGVFVQVADKRVLRSSATGILTGSACTNGGTVASGASTWSVDGQPLVSLATSIPLWRDMTAGVKGSDVSALQEELARLGYGAVETGVYDQATRNAVKELMSHVGGHSSDGSLLRSWVVWLPSKEVKASSCAASTGTPIAAGGELANVAGALQALVLANPPGDGWVATYNDHTATVDADGRITDTAFLAAMEASQEYTSFASTGQGSLSVTVALAEPQQVLVVPPSSVVVAGPGRGCVVSASGVMDVDIVTSSLGQTLVSVKGGSAPTQIVQRPDAGTSCP